MPKLHTSDRSSKNECSRDSGDIHFRGSGIFRRIECRVEKWPWESSLLLERPKSLTNFCQWRTFWKHIPFTERSASKRQFLAAKSRWKTLFLARYVMPDAISAQKHINCLRLVGVWQFCFQNLDFIKKNWKIMKKIIINPQLRSRFRRTYEFNAPLSIHLNTRQKWFLIKTMPFIWFT